MNFIDLSRRLFTYRLVYSKGCLTGLIVVMELANCFLLSGLINGGIFIDIGHIICFEIE